MQQVFRVLDGPARRVPSLALTPPVQGPRAGRCVTTGLRPSRSLAGDGHASGETATLQTRLAFEAAAFLERPTALGELPRSR